MQLYQVQNNKNLSKKTKLQIFNTNVKSVLLYACVTGEVLKSSRTNYKAFSIGV
jgi:hypothetical protein